MIEKVIRDGRVAVLVSRGYGAGWSSWSPEIPQLLFEPRVVEILEGNLSISEKEELINKFVTEKYPDTYMGGIDGLEVVWVQEGSKFVIREYDGKEWIEFDYKFNWITA
jgi:hypothetical protein